VADTVTDGPDELTEEETRAMLEEQTQRVYGLSLDDFIRRAEAGDLPAHPDLVHLVLLSGARTDAC
jgi:hypothetical protein